MNAHSFVGDARQAVVLTFTRVNLLPRTRVFRHMVPASVRNTLTTAAAFRLWKPDSICKSIETDMGLSTELIMANLVTPAIAEKWAHIEMELFPTQGEPMPTVRSGWAIRVRWKGGEGKDGPRTRRKCAGEDAARTADGGTFNYVQHDPRDRGTRAHGALWGQAPERGPREIGEWDAFIESSSEPR